MDTTASAPPLEAAPTAAPRRIYRHRLPVRLMHWINVVCLVVLLGSGLNIFNAHPALYWGHDSSGDAVALDARREHAGRCRSARPASAAPTSTPPACSASRRSTAGRRRAPSRAGRRSPARSGWRWRAAGTSSSPGCSSSTASPTCSTRSSAGTWRGTWCRPASSCENIGRSILDHLKLKHPTGDAALRYNVLQSLTYLVVIFGLLPLVVIAGLAMSPRLERASSPAGSTCSAGASRRARCTSSPRSAWCSSSSSTSSRW